MSHEAPVVVATPQYSVIPGGIGGSGSASGPELEASLAPGKYLVTGGRTVMTTLTVLAADKDGAHRWQLDDGAKLIDVTHLRCRSARYKPATAASSCTPAAAQQSNFPVAPGGLMPAVNGCSKQDYAVLFLVGVAEEQ